MPRDGSGVYTLPAGNPVITATPIATAWANGTFNDVASALTDSLSRSGLGGMTAPFKLFDGTVIAPGLAFLNEPGNGFWRNAATPGYIAHASLGATNFIMGPELSTPRVLRFTGGDEKGTILQVAGFRRIAEYMDAGIRYTVPSATIDADDWDLTKFMSFNAVSGVAAFGVIPSAGTPARPVLTSFGGWTITDQPVTMNFAGSMQYKFDLPAAPAGNSGYIVWQRAGSVRWAFGVLDDEGGGNSGSNLYFTAFDDAGVQLGVFAKVTRSTGVWDFSTIPSVAGKSVLTTAGGWTVDSVFSNFLGGISVQKSALVERIAPWSGAAVFPGGAWDWNATSYNQTVAPGTAISNMTNESAGQMMRMVVTGAGALGAIANASGFTWAKGSPVWGLYRTIVTFLAMSANGPVVGFTAPIDTVPV